VNSRTLAPVLHLASASPRRRALLEQIGVAHEVVVTGVDEGALPGERPRDYVERLALAKARAAAAQPGRTPLPVLAADTTVVLDGELLGKPRDRAEGLSMLGRLSGRTHKVLTAVALLAGCGLEHLRTSVSHVRFRTIGPAEREAYWETGEPLDKAGGYAIQGFGAVFVAHLEGSYSGVVGLPLCETAELLQEAGIAWWGTIDP